MSDDYKATIGIETHVQLKTKTKLFSSVDNDARNAKPNTLISHIDVGLPGALPVLNERAIELACVAAFALNTEPQKFSKFDRKHYFYPDLPKGYQITQYEQPIIKGGFVEIMVDGKTKKIGITRVHLEEDAGKNTHPPGADYTLVDLNRAGTPLLEIVSEPDISSPAEAKAYARELYLLMKYAGVSDVNLYLGHMRFDVNVSVSKSSESGVRTETKNLNSFRSVEAAIAYEIKRQAEELKKGNKIFQETRGWDEAKQKTVPQRGKEEAHDYRYMPEPDIPPIELTDEKIKSMKSLHKDTLKELRELLQVLSFDRTEQEGFINMDVDQDFMPNERLSEVYRITDDKMVSMRAANWMLNRAIILNKQMSWPSPVQLIEAIQLYSQDKLSSNSMDAVLIAATLEPKRQIEDIAQEMKLLQVSDESAIEKIVDQVIKDNPKVVEDIKAGQEKAIGYLVGQVMAASKGSANPSLARKIIKQKLGI